MNDELDSGSVVGRHTNRRTPYPFGHLIHQGFREFRCGIDKFFVRGGMRLWKRRFDVYDIMSSDDET
jgi:hypothetical protein